MQCTGAAHGSRRVWVGYGYQLVALNITSWCVQYKFRLRLLACLLACVYARSTSGVAYFILLQAESERRPET